MLLLEYANVMFFAPVSVFMYRSSSSLARGAITTNIWGGGVRGGNVRTSVITGTEGEEEARSQRMLKKISPTYRIGRLETKSVVISINIWGCEV